MFSLAHQIDAVVGLSAAEVLEVGIGTGVVAAAIRAAGIPVTTLDVQPELEPDLLGSVTAIPAPDGRFDVALCCQVLEHLPFEEFEQALRELRRVTRSGLVLSLPDVTRYYYCNVKLPKLRARWCWSWSGLRLAPIPVDRFHETGHHWEIGVRGYPLARVTRAIESVGWRVVRTWRVSELSWHRFFELRHSVRARDSFGGADGKG